MYKKYHLGILEYFGEFSFTSTNCPGTPTMSCVESPVVNKTQPLSSLSLTLVEKPQVNGNFRYTIQRVKHRLD